MLLNIVPNFYIRLSQKFLPFDKQIIDVQHFVFYIISLNHV